MMGGMSFSWHQLTTDKTAQVLETSPQGLTSDQVKKARAKYGSNTLPKKAPESILLILFKQINNLLNYVLIAAAIVSLLTNHQIDFWVILLILVVNTSIGTYHHLKSRKIVSSLSESFEALCLVMRDGHKQKIPASELVPGDVLILTDGDKFPADVRFFETSSVEAVESSLTGESKSVEKNTEGVVEEAPLAERSSMGFAGTVMVRGEARAYVVETGLETQIGQIASSIQDMKQEKTLFERRTDKLVKQMVGVTVTTSTIILIIGWWRGIEFGELILFVLATLISGIPEGLPTVLIIVLSIAALRMSRRKALLKNLAAIESLSSVTTIITDKTGTLTQNIMSINTLRLGDGRQVAVTGTTWEPNGEFSIEGNKIEPSKDPVLRRMLEYNGLNQQAEVTENDHGWENLGDPTEASRVVLSEKAGFSRDSLNKKYELLESLPYDQATKYRQGYLRARDGSGQLLVVVGGAEKVLARCEQVYTQDGPKTLDQKLRQEFADHIESQAAAAYRMQALGYREMPGGEISDSELERAKAGPLVLLGVMSVHDPVRADVPGAVAKAQAAGIRVIMATGDHPLTALSIGQKTGIANLGNEIQGQREASADQKISQVLTDQDMEKMSDQELLHELETTTIFARMTPAAKLRLANLLQNQGHVIAMTGDGTNDAPALKSADVGIAMGRIGTDAAREAADLVLLDDNFATIVAAIEEGRTVFRNVRQTSLYLLTTNFAEGMIMMSAVAMGFALPLLPLQILWLNLVTDGVSGWALATEKPQSTTLTNPPRKKRDGILSRKNLIFILAIASAMVVLTLGLFAWWMTRDLDYARTVAFTFMVFCQLFNMINLRSLDLPITEIGFFSNRSVNLAFFISTALLILITQVPVLTDIFRFAPISLPMIGAMFALSSVIFFAGEGLKRAHTID